MLTSSNRKILLTCPAVAEAGLRPTPRITQQRTIRYQDHCAQEWQRGPSFDGRHQKFHVFNDDPLPSCPELFSIAGGARPFAGYGRLASDVLTSLPWAFPFVCTLAFRMVGISLHSEFS